MGWWRNRSASEKIVVGWIARDLIVTSLMRNQLAA
jgi:hypothetical protein